MQKTITALVVLLVAFGGAAQANLVANHSFETGDLTGWTDGGNTGWNTVSGAGAPDGAFHIDNGAVGCCSVLSQVLTTTLGTVYNVSLLHQDGDGSGQIWASWNGVLIAGTESFFSAHAYGLFSGTVLGTGSDTIAIHVEDDPNFLQYDDIHVEAVPEPATLSMIGLAMLGLPIAMKLRRRKK